MDVFLEKHCLRCHGPEAEEGELRIDRLSRDFKIGGETHLWAELIERVNSGEMPLKTEPQPTQDEIAIFVTKPDSLIKEGRAARMAARPPGGQLAHLSVGTEAGRNRDAVNELTELDITAPEDRPEVYESEVCSRCQRRYTSTW